MVSWKTDERHYTCNGQYLRSAVPISTIVGLVILQMHVGSKNKIGQ